MPGKAVSHRWVSFPPSAASASLKAIDPLPSLSTKLKWEGLFRPGVPCEAESVL